MTSDNLNNVPDTANEVELTQMELPLEDTSANNVEKETTPTKEEQAPTPKRERKRTRKEAETIIEVEPTEIEKLREMLKAVEGERDKLASECSALNETVKNLQEEVKITPKKLAKVVQDMGIAPLAIGREKTQKMTMEAYNAMTDSQRRDWQRKNRSDYLEMMHSVKLGTM